MSFTTHNTVFIFGAIWCLVPETLALETLKDRGCCLKLLDPENYACFLAYKSPRSGASACFGSSLFILMNGGSFPDLLDFIRSASAWVILLKSSSSLNSLTEMLFDTPLNTEYLLFEASAE